MLGQLIAQATEQQHGGSFPLGKVVLAAAHVVLALVGLAFGGKKAKQAERAPEPSVLDEKQLAEQHKAVHNCVLILLILGAAVTGRCIYTYLAKGSQIAESNAWHAATTMLLPAVVYWILTRGPALQSPYRLLTLRLMTMIHAILSGLIVVLYIVAYEKGLMYWIVMTAFQALLLMAISETSAKLRRHLLAAPTAAVES